MQDEGKDLVRRLTAEIVAAYVDANSLAPDQLPDLIIQVHRVLAGLARGETDEEARGQPKAPTMTEIRRSIRPDGLVSFENGKVYKTLKRHLVTQGLTPSEYRAKWGLSEDYPMVAADYAARRSELATASGLGRRGGTRQRAKR